ncbi:leucine aminopeptidase, putative [Babesia caballi]|uniref:Leucine aminopeptidase, putative n=1 Tax=Babesia caballi TaxID=5871 RepID=A0AAV4LVP7_BABCB|nr:leucine aminopeptidase, putative [Babesia caballi]
MVDRFPVTEAPAASVSVDVFTAAAPPTEADFAGFDGNVVVFHLAFAAKAPAAAKSANFDLARFESFPSKFFTSEAGVRAVAASANFSGKLSEVVEFFSAKPDGSLAVEAVAGCGRSADFLTSDAYALAKTLAKVASHHRCKHVLLMLGDLAPDLVESVVTGMLNEISVDKRFRKDQDPGYKLEALHVAASSVLDGADMARRCRALAVAMHTTRELVTAPANYANTVSVANYVKEKYTALGLTVKVLSEADCRALGMGSYLAVGQGSRYPPQFLHATYVGEGHVKTKIAFVGKGIMFDSGGLNIKSAASEIELMKFDMGGMSTIFGAAEAIAALKPSGVEVHFISATCENMPGPNAYRPGDVVTASNGKTIEVNNTDAEGRLTLADALVYAEKLQVDYIIDAATLTGGCIIALGYQYGGYFANDEGLNALFQKALDKSGELAWRLPLAKQYAPSIESKVADLTNANAAAKAPTINAALFLKEFVESTKWVHWDIAGTAFDKASGRGTGYGVRTLVNLVLGLAGQ